MKRSIPVLSMFAAVTAILTLAAKTWRDWRRFTPLLTVVAAPIGFGLGALVGNLGMGVGLIYVLWVLLGYAVRTAQTVPVLRQSAA